MGITAENVAEKYEISRQAQDEFAAESQKKAAAAMDSGAFKEEIVAVAIPAKKGDPVVRQPTSIRGPRPTSKVAGAEARVQEGGTVTAGNASGINDGAAALVVMSEARAKALKLTPLAVIRGAASAGVDPSIMGMGPWPASEKALARLKLDKKEIDLWELNEAFAAQSLGVLAELKIARGRST